MPHTPFTNPFINWGVQLSYVYIYYIYIHYVNSYHQASEYTNPKLVTYVSTMSYLHICTLI